MRKVAVVIAAFVLCWWLTLPASSEDKKPKTESTIEHDFGTKIVSVRTSSSKTDNGIGFTAGLMKNVQVRRLGDRSFLVGEVIAPDSYKDVRFWIPLSAVLELAEFENIHAVDSTLRQLRAAAEREAIQKEAAERKAQQESRTR